MSKTHMPMWKSVFSFYASFTCRFISYNKSVLCYTGMWGERPHGSERLSTGNCQQCVGGRDQQASARKTLVSHTKRFITIHYIQNGMTHRLNSTWSTHWFLVNSTKSVYIYVNNILITWHIHIQGPMIQRITSMKIKS